MKIYGNKSLLEKFSESMPDWVKRGLEYSKHNYDKIKYSGHKKEKPDPSKLNVYNKVLNEKGIDLNKAKFIEDDVPNSGANLKKFNNEFKLPILGFDTRQIWIPGVNDDENLNVLTPYKDTEIYRPFRDWSVKKLLSLATHFAYIDLEDSNSFSSTTSNKRYDARQGSVDRVDVEDQNPEFNYDKSGYKNDRLGKNVDELKKEISNKIDDLEGRKERVAKAKADRENNKSTPQEVEQEVEKIEDEIEDLDEINAHLYKLDNSIEQMDELVFKAKRIILKNRKTYKSIMSRNKAKQYYTTEFGNVNEYIGEYHRLINKIEDVKALIPDSKGDDEFIIRKLDRITKSLEEFVDSFPVKEFSMTSGIQHLNRWGNDEGISVLG